MKQLVLTVISWCWKCNDPEPQIVLEKHYISDTCYLYKIECKRCHSHNPTLKDPAEFEKNSYGGNDEKDNKNSS